MDRVGYGFLAVLGIVTIGLAILGWTIWALIGLVLSIFVGAFFRDPNRNIPADKRAVVAPADGKIIAIEKVSKSPLFNGNLQKVSVFMTVFNVHVNRIPFNGNIKEVRYFPGKFFSANLDKASSDNEKNAIWIETEGGNRYCVVQIAGLIARRIICRVEKGNPVTRGQRFGIICFGSRVDTYLPQDVDLSVAIGDRTRAGETVLGYLP